MAETDAVLNAETRRALRRRVRQLSMVAVGSLVAIVISGVAGLAAMFSVPWQLHLAVTVGVTVAIPVGVPYVMLRVLGLSHQDVLYVGKQAYQEGVAETIALSGTRRTADVFGGSESATGDPAEATESAESPSPDEMDTVESSTESEPTDPQQQAEPQPQS